MDSFIACHECDLIHQVKSLPTQAVASCTRCGASHPAIIDFHHVDRNDPDKHKVHQLFKSGKYKKAYEEIKKCLILCANCHRIHHWEERNQKL